MRQRVVVVIGFAAGLYFFGSWITSRVGTATGWTSYAPLSIGQANPPGPGLHPWVRLIIWLALILIWVLSSVFLLRSPRPSRAENPTETTE
jgi:heme/copper-type cytochrome/quinol oxidase subunit 1